MRLERITARDARSATEQVLARFGPDALIVSNQRVDGMTELIVAVDVEAPEAPEAAPAEVQSQSRVQTQAGGDGQIRMPAQAKTQAGAGTGARTQAGAGVANQAGAAIQPGAAAQAGSSAQAGSGAPTGAASFGDTLLRTGAALRNAPRMIETRTVEPRAPARLSPQLPHSLLPRRGGPISHAEVEHWLSPPADAPVPAAVSAAPQPAAPPLSSSAAPAASLPAAPATSAAAPVTSPPTSVDSSPPTPAASTLAPSRDATSADADGRGEQLRAREIVDLVRAEFAVMRRELLLAQQIDALQPAAGLPAHVRELADAMAEAGVPVGLKTLLIDEIRASADQKAALEAIRERLEQSIPDAAPHALQRGVQVLMGPSGCGKTTLAARMVAQHAASHGPESVALVSYDDPRPGAWSQLQMLAARSGVECYRAQSPEALATVLGELAGRALVVIDTGSQNLAERRAGIARAAAQAQFHLVLPAEASMATVQRHCAHESVPWQGLMLTKLDESVHPWPILQALCNRPMALGLASDSPQARDAAQAIRSRDLVSRAIEGLTHTLTAGTRNMWGDSSVSSGARAPTTESVHAN